MIKKLFYISIFLLTSLLLNQCSTYTVKKDMTKKGELTKNT